MPEPTPTYLHRGQRGIFAEVYFPRRVDAQGTIFSALSRGYREEVVKAYLARNAEDILAELQDYQHIFDHQWYDMPLTRKPKPSLEDTRRRIDEYVSPFYGWSSYVVDGVFFDNNGIKIEEATQVIRMMFRFDSTFTQRAADDGCQDVLRAMLFWLINRQARINELAAWDEAEQKRFLKEYDRWRPRKRKWVQKHFEPVAREAMKWREDCFLFTFGYLVRQFSERLRRLGHPEDEIWVASYFDLMIVRMKRIDQ